MDAKRQQGEISEQEAARRRDEVLRHMISRPPQPHAPLKASKSKTRPASKGRIHKGRSRN
jgi:hypothetical protein